MCQNTSSVLGVLNHKPQCTVSHVPGYGMYVGTVIYYLLIGRKVPGTVPAELDGCGELPLTGEPAAAAGKTIDRRPAAASA